MNATCPSCGKVLKVKDEWAGRTLKCPQCTHAFKIGGTGQTRAVATGYGPTPKAAKKQGATPPQRAAKVQEKAGISINWGPIVLIAGLAVIVLVVVLIVLGPIRVHREWEARQGAVEDEVRNVMGLAAQCEASQAGTWDANKSTGMPSVVDVNFQPNFMVMTLPSTVRFMGVTSNGKFEGDYTFASGEIAGTLTVGGITLAGVHIDGAGVTLPGGKVEAGLPGMPMRGGANVDYAITGRSKEGAASCEIDGKTGLIYYRPKVDEDGNPIRP